MSRPSAQASFATYLGCMAMALAAPFVCLACLQVSTTGSDAGSGSSATSSDAETSASDGGAGWTGTSCGPDPQTGVVLCLGTSECPNATIDTSAFPSCGFHQGASSAFDLECICDGYELCPVGAPNSCDDVAQLLTQYMTSLQVCEQVSTGGCLTLDAGAGSGSSSGASGTTGLSAACQACISSCGTTPSCYQSCGC